MELKETADYMVSEKYSERLAAEYCQLEIRAEKLEEMIKKLKEDRLEFEPTCPIKLLKEQLDVMNRYAGILKERMRLEEIKPLCGEGI